MLESDKTKFPGLTATSIILWKEWLRLYQDRFLSFDYNVRVGQGLTPPANLPDNLRAMWQLLTKKRIDVVAFRPMDVWIIELNERPGNREAGNLEVYEFMLPRYFKVDGTITKALIGRYIGYDMFAYFKSQGVYVFKFAPGKPPSVPPTFLPSKAGQAYVSGFAGKTQKTT